MSNWPVYARVQCPTCGPMDLTEREYDRQMNDPWSHWRCPRCRCTAEFDDTHFEQLHGV